MRYSARQRYGARCWVPVQDGRRFPAGAAPAEQEDPIGLGVVGLAGLEHDEGAVEARG